ncbi:hypothetical protein VTK56DRAFT_2380 [Thermocarpiscus australiensis]
MLKSKDQSSKSLQTLTWIPIDNLFGTEDALEGHLLNKNVMPLNNTTEWLQSEGDSVRTFYTHVSHPIQLAFHTNGQSFMIQRSESGPLGPTQVSQTVDFTWGYGDRCVMIGELKRHRMIDAKAWRGEVPASHNRRWLGKELRAYCYKYNCFAGSVFDGKYLLVLVFQGRALEEIRSQACPVIGLLFSRNCATLRYGLFRVATNLL